MQYNPRVSAATNQVKAVSSASVSMLAAKAQPNLQRPSIVYRPELSKSTVKDAQSEKQQLFKSYQRPAKSPMRLSQVSLDDHSQ